MSSKGTLLFELFFGLMLAGCAKTALPPVAPPLPAPVSVTPPKAHQADVPSPDAVLEQGDEKNGKHKLAFTLPEKGNWHQAPAELVPKSWRGGFVSLQHKALVLMDLSINAPPAADLAGGIRAMMQKQGTKCGPVTPFAGGSGYAFVIDEGGGTYGKVAIRDLGPQPGKYVLQLYGQWPKSANAPLLEQFDYIAAHATME